MSTQTTKNTAVIGAGVIGLSWAAMFAAAGYQVRVYDPRPDLADILHTSVALYISQIPAVQNAGADVNALAQNVSVAQSVEEAVCDAMLIQEAGPEKIEFKQALFAQIEQFAAPDAMIVSSSSGIPSSVAGLKMRDVSRLLIGHPFNPPHILPLVEVCAAPSTAQRHIDVLMDFYTHLGKKPIQLHKEIKGFVVNRLQAVLIREAAFLVEQGVVNMAELDELFKQSLGVRYATIGPLLSSCLGGGAGGVSGFMNHIMNGLIETVGQTPLSAASIDLLERQSQEAYPAELRAQLIQKRDRQQIWLVSGLEAV